MAKLRLGVALLLEPPLADEVNGLRRALGDRTLKRVPPHLTLVPPVNVPLEKLGVSLAVLRAAAGATAPRLAVTLGPPTSFLPANPVLYLPVADEGNLVTGLRQRVWEPPLIRSLTWPYVPHVTLADDVAPGAIEAAVSSLGGFRVDATFDRVHLLVERHPGSQWVSLADVAFGPPAIVGRGGPLAVELTRSRQIDPEGRALLEAEGAQCWDMFAAGEAGALVVTARREGAVVGVGRAWPTPDGCRSAIVVATPHRRQGIGRHIDAALEHAVADAGWHCRYPRLTAGA